MKTVASKLVNPPGLDPDYRDWHGHVRARPDGLRAKCGVLSMCAVCQAEYRMYGAGAAAYSPLHGQEKFDARQASMKTVQSKVVAFDSTGPTGGNNDGDFDRIRTIAAKLGLKVEMEEDILAVIFPKTNYSYIPAKDGKPGAPTDPKKTAVVTPELMTIDGVSWAPEFVWDGEPGWAGAIDLTGMKLRSQIQTMVVRCNLGDATRVKMFEFLDALGQ